MPTLTLNFDLPEEKGESDHALRGGDYYAMLYDIASELRRRVKYGTPDRDVADFNDWLWVELGDRGIDPFA